MTMYHFMIVFYSFRLYLVFYCIYYLYYIQCSVRKVGLLYKIAQQNFRRVLEKLLAYLVKQLSQSGKMVLLTYNGVKCVCLCPMFVYVSFIDVNVYFIYLNIIL